MQKKNQSKGDPREPTCVQTWQPVFQNRRARNCTNSPLRMTRIHSLTGDAIATNLPFMSSEFGIHRSIVEASVEEEPPVESTGWRAIS